jgi:hypothetical protein
MALAIVPARPKKALEAVIYSGYTQDLNNVDDVIAWIAKNGGSAQIRTNRPKPNAPDGTLGPDKNPVLTVFEGNGTRSFQLKAGKVVVATAPGRFRILTTAQFTTEYTYTDEEE